MGYRARYWMYLLDVGKGMESHGHAQSANTNFLGLHIHDTKYYIPVGAWVVDKNTYAFGNALMWTNAGRFLRGTGPAGRKWWQKIPTAIPDNMGTTRLFEPALNCWHLPFQFYGWHPALLIP